MPSSISDQLSIPSITISFSNIYFIILRVFLSIYKNCTPTPFYNSNLGYCRFRVQVIQNMFQCLCIFPTWRCPATRLKNSISAAVILHLSLAIIFEVSVRGVEELICQHSATLYLQHLNLNCDHYHRHLIMEYSWYIIGSEGAYPSTKKWV
jgi:hypothetical protein